jgi:PEP-CTERM motif
MPNRSSYRVLGSVVVLSAAVSLSPEGAKADKVFDFSGACSSGCSGTATGVLTLTDAYVYGSDIALSDFISMDYSSSHLNFDLTSLSSVQGGLNSDGSLVGGVTGALGFNPTGPYPFFELSGLTKFSAGVSNGVANLDFGLHGGFTPVGSSVPEASTWAMMLAGFAALGFAIRRRVPASVI